MDYFLFVATVSLIIQLVIVALLLAGYLLKKKGRFLLHGFIMLTAFAAHLAAIGVIMVPSLVIGIVPKILSNPTAIISVLSSIHTAAGATATLLGIYVIGAWRIRRETRFCAPKAKVMRATFIIWLTSVSLGGLLYFVLNWNLLFP